MMTRTYRKTALYIYDLPGRKGNAIQEGYTMEQYADEYNYRFVEHYHDESCDRPALIALMDDVAAGKIATLLVPQLCQLGDMDKLLDLSKSLQEHSVRLIAVGDLFGDSSQPMKRELWENGMHYTLHGDYYLPDILSRREENRSIGRWGWRHLNYLRMHKPDVYQEMLKDGTLYEYLVVLNQQAEQLHRTIMDQSIQDKEYMDTLFQGVRTTWNVRLFTLCAIADGHVLSDLIYV